MINISCCTADFDGCSRDLGLGGKDSKQEMAHTLQSRPSSPLLRVLVPKCRTDRKRTGGAIKKRGKLRNRNWTLNLGAGKAAHKAGRSEGGREALVRDSVRWDGINSEDRRRRSRYRGISGFSARCVLFQRLACLNISQSSW